MTTSPPSYLPMLRRAKVGGYARLRDRAPLREVALPLEPSRLQDVEWAAGTARLTGPNAEIDFALPHDTVVAGIRLRYRYRDRENSLPYVRIAWRASYQPDLSEQWLRASSQHRKFSPTGDRATWERGTWTRRHDATTTMTAWISRPVEQIRIMPNIKPGTFEIIELTLLMPAS